MAEQEDTNVAKFVDMLAAFTNQTGKLAENLANHSKIDQELSKIREFTNELKSVNSTTVNNANLLISKIEALAHRFSPALPMDPNTHVASSVQTSFETYGKILSTVSETKGALATLNNTLSNTNATIKNNTATETQKTNNIINKLETFYTKTRSLFSGKTDVSQYSTLQIAKMLETGKTLDGKRELDSTTKERLKQAQLWRQSESITTVLDDEGNEVKQRVLGAPTLRSTIASKLAESNIPALAKAGSLLQGGAGAGMAALGMVGSLGAGLALSAAGFIAGQLKEVISDHILSAPKTSANYYRAQYLAGTKQDLDLNGFGAGNYVGELFNHGLDRWHNPANPRVAYDRLRLYANTIGIKNDEFYKKFHEFIGAGGSFNSQNAMQNFRTSMTYEKQFGNSFSMEFLNTFERVSGSTGDLNKHIQVLTGVAGNLTTVSQKHVQALAENFYQSMRGQYDSERLRKSFGMELATFTPLLSKNILSSNEVTELLNLGSNQGIQQRMTSAAFMPAYNGNFLGGAEQILQNTRTPEGRLRNYQNYMSILRQFTGGAAISSLSDEQMSILRSQASGIVPGQLLDKAVLQDLEKANDPKERDRLLKEILNGQDASERAAASLNAMEDPLKAIRDNIVAWGFLGKPGTPDKYIDKVSKDIDLFDGVSVYDYMHKHGPDLEKIQERASKYGYSVAELNNIVEAIKNGYTKEQINDLLEEFRRTKDSTERVADNTALLVNTPNKADLGAKPE